MKFSLFFLVLAVFPCILSCVICVNARATMQTAPCGHRVVCRRCFVKTIQMAVSQRLLPLRCVICRAKILRLKQTLIPRDYSMSGKSWVLPQSASEYNMATGVPVGVPGPGGRWTSGNVPASASLYSMSSGSSSISGVSFVSSATSSSISSAGSSGSSIYKSKSSKVRQPVGTTFRKNQTQSMKIQAHDYQDPIQPAPENDEVPRDNRRLPPIKEFQRDFKFGKTSTRLRCAQKIVTQLEAGPPQPRPSTSKSSNSIVGTSMTSSTSSSSTSSNKETTTKRSSSTIKTTSSNLKTNAKPLTVAQEVQRTKKEKEREKEREKAEKARLKEEVKAEKARQKEAKKLAKEEKKRAKKEAKARRKESEEALLRNIK